MIHFDVNMDGLAEIEKELGMAKDKSRQVLKTAINNTAKQTVNLLVEKAKEKYVINKPSKIRESITLQKAAIGKLYAVIRSTGKSNDLYMFSVKPRAYRPDARPEAGHKAKVVRANAGGRLEMNSITESGPFTNPKDPHKAFVVKYASGHIAVARRMPGTRRKTPRPSHPKGEEAIKNLQSVAVPKMLGSEQRVFGVIRPQIYDLLQKNIQEQIQRYLG